MCERVVKDICLVINRFFYFYRVLKFIFGSVLGLGKLVSYRLRLQDNSCLVLFNLIVESFFDINFIIDLMVTEFLFLSGVVLNLLDLVFIDYIRKSRVEVEFIVLIMVSLLV